MKKEILSLGIILVLFISLTFIIAEEDISPPSPPAIDKENAAENVVKTATDLQTRTNKVLSQKVELPENLQVISKVLFGINSSESPDFSTFIVLIALWIFILLVVHSTLELIPFFEQEWISWATAIIITALSSITGALKAVAEWFFGLGTIFKDQSMLRLIVTVILLAIIGYGATKIIHILKHESKKAARRQAGFKAASEALN